MELDQILRQTISNLENQKNTIPALSIKEIADLPVFLTPEEAFKLQFALSVEPPNSILCEFCGNNLYPIGRRSLTRREVIAWEKFQECQCEAAVNDRNRKLLEEIERQAKEEVAALRAEFNAKVERLFKQSKLGERFKTRTFENFKVNNQNKSAYETALKYAREFEKYKKDGIGLNLNGTYGSGKTHLAAAITIKLIGEGIPVIFGTTITLLGKLKQSYDNEIKESEGEIIDLYSYIDLLVIDDLGKERINEWVLEKLYLIINSRYENNLPIVITTNYNIDSLTNRLSTDKNRETAEAITSRLWEICRGVEMNFEDYRKQ